MLMFSSYQHSTPRGQYNLLQVRNWTWYNWKCTIQTLTWHVALRFGVCLWGKFHLRRGFIVGGVPVGHRECDLTTTMTPRIIMVEQYSKQLDSRFLTSMTSGSLRSELLSSCIRRERRAGFSDARHFRFTIRDRKTCSRRLRRVCRRV